MSGDRRIDDVKSDWTLTKSKFSKVRESCSQSGALVAGTMSEHANHASSSRGPAIAGHHALLSMEGQVEQAAHLRPIFEKRCEFDMMTVAQDDERQSSLQAIAKVRTDISRFCVVTT